MESEKCNREARKSGKVRKKREKWILLLFITGVFLFTSGCVSRIQKTRKLRDLDYTIVDKDMVPQELQLLIEENKSMPFKLTYMDQGKLYIAEGYGVQLTTGYSVEVVGLYETEDAVYIHTNLLGPEKEEQIKECSTFPYIVVQLAAVEKQVMFD